jgi:hypothetical protein
MKFLSFLAPFLLAFLPTSPGVDVQQFSFTPTNGFGWAAQGFDGLHIEKSPVPLQSITIGGDMRGYFAFPIHWSNSACEAGNFSISKFRINFSKIGWGMYLPNVSPAINGIGNLSHSIPSQANGGAKIAWAYAHRPNTNGFFAQLSISPGDSFTHKRAAFTQKSWTFTDPAILNLFELQPGEPIGTTVLVPVVENLNYNVAYWPCHIWYGPQYRVSGEWSYTATPQ